MKRIVIGIFAILLVTFAAGFADQAKGKSMMQNMSMDDMMKNCQASCQKTSKSIDEMMKMMDEAKKSNDPQKMKVAMDQMEKSLSQMKEHMTKCMDMMNMMQMHGKGMMMGNESQTQKH